jgi:hypothetical protein
MTDAQASSLEVRERNVRLDGGAETLAKAQMDAVRTAKEEAELSWIAAEASTSALRRKAAEARLYKEKSDRLEVLLFSPSAVTPSSSSSSFQTDRRVVGANQEHWRELHGSPDHRPANAASPKLLDSRAHQDRSGELSFSKLHLATRHATSASFTPDKRLLSGRYPHAHRSYKYEADESPPVWERLQLRALEHKHGVQMEAGGQIDRSRHGGHRDPRRPWAASSDRERSSKSALVSRCLMRCAGSSLAENSIEVSDIAQLDEGSRLAYERSHTYFRVAEGPKRKEDVGRGYAHWEATNRHRALGSGNLRRGEAPETVQHLDLPVGSDGPVIPTPPLVSPVGAMKDVPVVAETLDAQISGAMESSALMAEGAESDDDDSWDAFALAEITHAKGGAATTPALKVGPVDDPDDVWGYIERVRERARKHFEEDPRLPSIAAGADGTNNSCEPSAAERAILFLAERVAALEAAHREHEEYIRDLTEENEDLLDQYAKLAAAVSVDGESV